MKKPFIFVLFAFILLVQGCGDFRNESDSEIEKQVLLVESEKDKVGINADIQATKTVFGEDGLTTLWEENDCIGLLYYSPAGTQSGDAGQYHYSTYVLESGAGRSEGFFTGDRITSPMVIKGAFYPCPETINLYASNTGNESILMNLATEQQQTGDEAVLRNYDFKVAESIEDTSEGYYASYKISFRQKTAVLRFRITPTEGMLSLGENVKQVTLVAQGRTIAGYFRLPIYDADAPVIPEETSGADSGNPRVTVFTDREVTSEGICLPMFILPTIKENDNLNISICTESRMFSFTGKATKDFESGYSYTMTVDLPTLEQKGLLTESSLTNPLLSYEEPGIYDLSHAYDDNPYITEKVTLSQYWQHSSNRTTARFQNWENKQLIQIEHPSSISGVGQTINITVSTYGQGLDAVTTGAAVAKVLKIENGSYWIVDEEGKIGYIIK